MAVTENTPVPTPTGWILARDLQATDFVFGMDGQPKRIVSIQSYEAPTYLVEMSDNTGVIGDRHLTFLVLDKAQRNRIFTRIKHLKENKVRSKSLKLKYQSRSVDDLLEHGIRDSIDQRRAYSVPTTQPVTFKTIDYPVPPFVVGLWYMTKRRYNQQIMFPENFRAIEKKLRSLGYLPLIKKQQAPRYEIRPPLKYAFLVKYPTVPTTIPDDYYIGNPDQRLELLRGILWGRPNCYIEDKDSYNFRTKDYRFIRKLQGLCESLGVRTRLQFRKSYGIYQLTFKTNLPIMPGMKETNEIGSAQRRYIKNIVAEPTARCVHITAEEPFVVGEGYIPIC